MNLKVQIIGLIFSFLYGIIFSLLVNINYKYLFSKRLAFKITMTFVFIIDCSLLYFLILKKINEGIIHPYFLLMILIGFYVSFPISKKFRKNDVK